MAMSHEETIKTKLYQNWIKSGLGLKYLKEGLQPFVTQVIKDQHTKFVEKLQPCSSCSLGTLLPSHALKVGRNCSLGCEKCLCIGSKHTIRTPCPTKVCGKLYDKIVMSHVFTDPNFSNTDVTKWVEDPWELAKCYINAWGYKDKRSAEDTDCLGILSIVINDSGFYNLVDPATIDICKKVRTYRNDIMHSSSLEVEDVNLKTYIEDMIAILNDPNQLKDEEYAESARTQLQKLLDKEIHIATSDEISVIQEVQIVQARRLDDMIQKTFHLDQMTKENREQFDCKESEKLKKADEKLKEHLKYLEDKNHHWKLKWIMKKLETDPDLKVIMQYDKEFGPMYSDLLAIGGENTVDLWSDSWNWIKKLKVCLKHIHQDERIMDDVENSLRAKRKEHIPTTQYVLSKTEKGFYHCLENNDQIGILDLLQKGKCQDQHKLKKLCRTFGRKHPLIKIACMKICEIIKNKNPKLPDVWPAYKMKPEEKEVDETNICFVIETEDIDHTVIENIDILQITRKSPNAENKVVKDYAYEHQLKLTGSDIKRIGKVINEEISLLREQHSNLVRIVPSPIKSIGFNTVNHQKKTEKCIALFVHAKGIIPLQEDCFPKKLGDFVTDVREGYCELAVGGGPHEIHDSLKIGCAIASFGAKLYGTIGGFLNHEECGECALTSNHVLSADEPKCVQPISDCQSKVFGEKIRSCFDGEKGVDAALIKIDKRHPSGGHFPDCSPEEMKLAGIINDRKLPFTSGKILSINESNYDDYQKKIILKYGAKTTFRRGMLEAFDLPTDVMVHGKQKTAFNNQILINSRTNYGKFAELGDSGSLVFILDNGHSFAIGIVMAVTDDGDAYVNPISKVLEVFECESLKSFVPESPAVSRKAAEKVKFDKDSSIDIVRKEYNNNDAPLDYQYRNNAENCSAFHGARPKSTCKAQKVVTNNYTSQQITGLTEKKSNQRTSSPETPTVKSRERLKKIIEGTKSSGSTNKLTVLSKRSTSNKTGVNMTSSRIENNDVLKKADLNKSIENDDETI